MAGSDGGVFSFGNAMYYGSAPGLELKLASSPSWPWHRAETGAGTG